MHIETPRFLLRDFSDADRQPFIDYQMDPRYRRLYNFNDSDKERARVLFDLFCMWREQKPRQNFQFGIFERTGPRLCGCAGLRQQGQPNGTAVFGLELTPDAWGRYGVAVEVASAFIEYGFHTLNLNRIMADTASGNIRAERLARWFGAVIVDHCDGAGWMKARGWQQVDWALSCDAWAASPARRRLLRTA